MDPAAVNCRGSVKPTAVSCRGSGKLAAVNCRGAFWSFNGVFQLKHICETIFQSLEKKKKKQLRKLFFSLWFLLIPTPIFSK